MTRVTVDPIVVFFPEKKKENSLYRKQLSMVTRQWKSILAMQGFCGAMFHYGDYGQKVVLHRSTRKEIDWQLSFFDNDDEAVMHENYLTKEHYDASIGYSMECLVDRLVRYSLHEEIHAVVLLDEKIREEKEKKIMRLEDKLEELFPELKKEEVSVGEKWVLDGANAVVYIAGVSEQGTIYKDVSAYENGFDEVCYIPEYGFSDYIDELEWAVHDYEMGNSSLEKLCKTISSVSVGYTHRDFLNLCNNQEEVASVVFDTVDWQYPETYFDEMFTTYELDEYEGKLVLTEGMSLKEYLYEKYKEDWVKEHISENRLLKTKGLYKEYLQEFDEGDEKPSFEDYIEENGYEGECYVCFDEFCENELKNKEYILGLLKGEQKPKYMVSIAVNGRVDVEVEADNFEEAKKKACAEVCDLDFGSLECIDWHAVNAENEHGVFKDYGIEKGYVGLNEIIQSVEEQSEKMSKDKKVKEKQLPSKTEIEIE